MGFIIYSLPRSRTFWLSQFLAYGNWRCGHDELRHVRGLDDLKSLAGMANYGCVETSAAPWWRLIHQVAPDISAAVIRRSVDEVVDSLMATGIAFDRDVITSRMQRLDAKLDQIEARVPGVLSVRFDQLRQDKSCAALMKHCTGEALDPRWFKAFSTTNLQCDLAGILNYAHAHAPQMERIAALAKQRILAGMSKRIGMDGMTFQTERFTDSFDDARALFREHCIEVGESADNYLNKNLALLEKLDELGSLQILTARSNGRMFGYLVTIIGPSLEHVSETVGTHTLFFASPLIPTLGRKLLIEATALLRERGTHEVLMRAGPRGSGPRLAPVYQRMGATDEGQWFKINLRAA